MISSEIFAASEPLSADAALVKDYLVGKDRCFKPLQSQELGRIRVVSSDASKLIWAPDVVDAAIGKWRTSRQKDSLFTDTEFINAVRSAGQNNEQPRVFIRRFEQLEPDLYPVQCVGDCQRLYQPAIPEDKAKPKLNLADDFYYAQCFERFHQWLIRFPLQNDDLVYIARHPNCTLIVEWGMFVSHWDVFYCDAFCTLNVIDDESGWFLFIHPDEIGIWGCTVKYASAHGVDATQYQPLPLDYRTILLKITQIDRPKYKRALDEKYAVIRS